MKKERLVCVEWDDAGYNGGYYDRDDDSGRFGLVNTKTVGHLVRSGRREVIVAQDRFDLSDGSIDLRHIATIPRGMIRKIRYLEDRR